MALFYSVMVFDLVTYSTDFVTDLVTFNFDLVTFSSPNRADKFFYTSALSTAKTVAIATIFAV